MGRKLVFGGSPQIFHRQIVGIFIAIAALIVSAPGATARECAYHQGWGMGFIKDLAVNRSKFWMNTKISIWSGSGKVRVAKAKTSCKRNAELYYSCTSRAKACK